MNLYIYKYDIDYGEGLALIVADDEKEADDILHQAIKENKLYGQEDWELEKIVEVYAVEKGLLSKSQWSG